MPGIVSDLVWDGSCLALVDASGEPLDLALTSIRYNAAISAVELRATMSVGHGPELVGKLGRGPLRMRLSQPGDDRVFRCSVHFETATLGFPFECENIQRPGRESSFIVEEVVILRGIRVEME